MANTDIILRPAKSADAAEITRIHYAALQVYHEFYGAFLAVHPRNLLPKLTVKALAMSDCFFFVAERRDSPGLVGFLRYQVKNLETDAKSALIDEKSDQLSEILFAPKSHLENLWEKFQNTEAHMDDCYERHTFGRKHIYVKHLMVDPSYQRQGIGKMLLQEVVGRSMRDALPIFIVSSKESHNLYLKFGFQDLAFRRIDNGEWAKMICDVEEESGLLENAGLEQIYRGVTEEEHLMALQPLITIQGT